MTTNASAILVHLPYLGPVGYYVKLQQFGQIHIEAHSNLVKTSYQNRCYIPGPNGMQALSIPIKGGRGQKTLYKDVLIDNKYRWQQVHWNSFKAAYGRSPFFEHYADDLEPFYKEEQSGLFDFNYRLFNQISSLLGFNQPILLTETFQQKQPDTIYDYRGQTKIGFKYQESVVQYPQVFEDRIGFHQNMSIVDLLFNEGPNAINLLGA